MNLFCRFCNSPLQHTFCDLGMSPLSNAFLSGEQAQQGETFYPLHAYVCGSCFLVQVPECATPQHIFAEDYAYFSSYSESWLAHASRYTDDMVRRFGYNANSLIIEIASNDGYLLQYFKNKNIPVLGIEPAANCAQAAQKIGVPTLVKFFGAALARELKQQGKIPDLVVGNNVLAHVPDLNDFVLGLKLLLKADGIITLEFPHLLRLMQENQFDTIYHEHYSYFSCYTVEKVFAQQGLKLVDAQQLPTHGGSLRIYVAHADNALAQESERLAQLRGEEAAAGIANIETYRRFAEQVKHTKRKFLEFLLAAKSAGKVIAGYGAPAKGNTLLNYCGVRGDFIDYTVDRSPHKQGKLLPGTHIPIFHPDRIRETKPDYLLILPWNLKEEIIEQMKYIREWGGKFVVPVPEIQVIV